jgi:hypothetical protein
VLQACFTAASLPPAPNDSNKSNKLFVAAVNLLHHVDSSMPVAHLWPGQT